MMNITYFMPNFLYIYYIYTKCHQLDVNNFIVTIHCYILFVPG